MSKEFDLDLAYEINGVEDAKRVYSDWAESYEGSLVDEMGYVAPRKIAEIYIENTADKSPVLDIGAGTGLLGQHLQDLTVDAIDITPAMLNFSEIDIYEKGDHAHAEDKGIVMIFRKLVNID